MTFFSRLIHDLRQATASFWAGVVVMVALMASFLPNVVNLVMTWWDEPNYSHGFLVAPIVLVILWQRRDTLPSDKIRPGIVGWIALVGLLVMRASMYESNQIWLENLTMLLSVVAITQALWGWHVLAWAAPGLLFMFFMLPLPQNINLAMSGPLQSLATTASAALLTASGVPVITEGNVIHMGTQPLEVARACNGLSILMSFVTLVTATVILVRDFPLWQRVVLLLSTVPIAIVSNILRIVATAWCYRLFGAEFGNKIAHDTAGFAMMPLALLLIWIELKVLSWVVIEEKVDRRDSMRLILQPTGGPGIVKK